MIYSLSTWLFFFYFYCFLGWIWETCYVSVLNGKWVNRGFMHGPFLPIYGFGAIGVLIATLQYREDAVAVFFVGMITATVLEYCTGAAMERIFHVRYWDYSKLPFNINGHVCLLASLAWGMFSVILTVYGHNPVERFALNVNSNILELIVLVLTAYIAVDFTNSFKAAIDLKEMLMELEENNEDFRRIQKRIEVVSTFYGEELKEKSEAGLKRINSAINTGKEMYERIDISRAKDREYLKMKSLLNRNPKAVSMMHEKAFTLLKKITDESETQNE